MTTRPVSVRSSLAAISPYVPGESLEAFSSRTGVPVTRLAKLNSNESPFPPTPHVAAALRQCVDFNYYPDPDHHPVMDRLAAYTGISRDHLLLTSGSMELIALLCRAFLDADDELIVAPPNFSFYNTAASLVHGTIIEVPRREGFALDVDAMLAAVTPRTKLIILASPNNPTGELVSVTQLDALLATGCIVAIDEVYLEFAGATALATSFMTRVPQHDNLVVYRSLSKWAGMAGLRLGYGAFPLWLLQEIRKIQMPFAVNQMALAAAEATLEDLPTLQRQIATVIAGRERLESYAHRLPFVRVTPSLGNFVLLHLDESRISLAAFRAGMEREGLILRYFTTPELRHCVRITIGTPEQVERVIAAMEQIALMHGVVATDERLVASH